MQIHELDTYTGTHSATDYLAVDDGTETTKIPLPSVGVTTPMTSAEAIAGSETAPRVISPAVLNSFVGHRSKYLSLDTSAQSGDDYELTQALTNLGWLNDVIV